MSINEIKTLAVRSGQHPFKIHLADGRVLEAGHPEFPGFPREPGVFVYFPETGGIQIIALSQVVSLDVTPQNKASAA